MLQSLLIIPKHVPIAARLNGTINLSRREREQQEGMPHDSSEGGRRPSVRVVSERVVRGRGRPRRQLQPDRLALRRAVCRGDRGGDNFNTLLDGNSVCFVTALM